MENKKTPITIDDIEYIYEDMPEAQQTLINHIGDLDRKISSSKFNLDQLQVGRDAFMSFLNKELKPPIP